MKLEFTDARVVPLDGEEYFAIKLKGFEQKRLAKKYAATLEGKTQTVTFKRWFMKRSLDANAYYFVLIGKMAETLRLTTTEIYRNHVSHIGGNYEILSIEESAVERFKKIWSSNGIAWIVDDIGESAVKGYRNLKAIYGSSTYDSSQMAQLIDIAIQDCNIAGIETKTPKEIEQLKNEWTQKNG